MIKMCLLNLNGKHFIIICSSNPLGSSKYSLILSIWPRNGTVTGTNTPDQGLYGTSLNSTHKRAPEMKYQHRRELNVGCSVTWYPTETIEIRLILSSRLNEQWRPVKKVTVKKECRSQRGYQQVLVLSNLRSPDTGRGEEGRSQMIGWGPKTEVAPFSPSAKKKNEKKC